MRLTYLIYIFLFSFFIVGCKTQQTTQAHADISSAAWEPTEKALLWSVRKKGFKPSFVYGTIHLIDKESFFLPAKTEESIAASNSIVYEINMEDMSDMGAQMGMLTKAFMNDGVTLKDLLSDDDYEMVENHFEDKGLPMMFLQRIKPMFLSVLVGDDMDPSMLQNGDMLSYEMELEKIASKNNLASGGLETIEYQLSIFDKIPYEDQAAMLMDAIKASGEEDTGMLDLFVKMYTDQDLKKMHDYTLHEESGMAKYADILLYDRNTNWIPKMEEHMKLEPTFFAVGAGHLGGTKGVLALLKERGFEVIPIK